MAMSKNPHCPHKSPEAMNEWKRQRKLIIQSKKHDRHKCDCEGCKLYWIYSVIVGRNGQFYEVLPSIKDIPIELWHQDFIMALRNRVMLPDRYKIIIEGKEEISGLWKVFQSNKQWVMKEA